MTFRPVNATSKCDAAALLLLRRTFHLSMQRSMTFCKFFEVLRALGCKIYPKPTKNR
jgi:hypothetical protein